MDRRKELKAQYKARKVVGGVYRILNRENGRYFIAETDDMQATRNWFAISQATDTGTKPAIAEDWKRYGKAAFVLEELDLLEKKEDQSDREFRAELKVLLELWSERFPREDRY